MTTCKIESESVATSTIAADRLLVRHLALARRLLILAIVGAGVAWLSGPAGRLLVVLPLLLFGPGFLLERALLTFARTPPFARPTLWLGLSLSAIALIYEWVTLLGLSLTPFGLALLAVACGLAVIWRLWIYDLRFTIYDLPNRQKNRKSEIVNRKWLLLLLAILALTCWTRISEIRDLALPNWVDSIHHALMIRVAAERGQAPLSLRPYMPVDLLPYHWGYHVFVAAAMRLSGLDLVRAMLWIGQTLNMLHALAAPAGRRRRGVGGRAALDLSGLLCQLGSLHPTDRPAAAAAAHDRLAGVAARAIDPPSS
jgi:hypothetical protein